jgi:acetyl esterase/lipase
MHEADVRLDIVYTAGADGQLALDVYRPAGTSPAERLPAVLIGGPPAFNAGRESGQKIGWAQLIAASGMAAIAFDISSDDRQATPFAPARDVAAAIQYVRANADALGVDADRLCTLGFSIGTAPWHLWATLRQPKPYVRCNVVYYGPLDFTSPEFDIRSGLIDEFSALTYLRRYGDRLPPMLVAKAGQDHFVGINESIDRFMREAKRRNADFELLVHENGVHGFDVDDHDARSREIIMRTLEFFAEHLLPQ